MEMLEDVAVYLILAPLVASVVLGAAAALWVGASRPAPARVSVRVEDRRRPR